MSDSFCPISAYGRARRLASRYCYGVNAAFDRLNAIDWHHDYAHLDSQNDWETILLFLSRLRRCISYLSRFQEYKSKADNAIASFDTIVPDLVALRNFKEHFDDYSLGEGRDERFDWGHLESHSFGVDLYENSAASLDRGSARQAALTVWAAIIDLESDAKELGYLDFEQRRALSCKKATGTDR